MILRNLWRRKTRTTLTLVCIALGAIAGGLTEKFGEPPTAGAAHLTAMQAGPFEVYFSAVDASLANDIATVLGVAWVEGVLLGRAVPR